MLLEGRVVGLVEDDPIMGESLVQSLSLEGCHVDWWKTGGEALRGLRASNPDLVVCDIRLPDISGDDMYRKLAENSSVPPFLFVTAYGNIDQAVSLMRAGAGDYRINGLRVDVPPLRKRTEDIPWLLDLFFEQFRGEGKTNLRGISTLVYELAHEHPWPGNVRELRNRMERAVAMAMGDWVMPADMFPDQESTLHPMLAAFSTLAEVRESAERRQIERALKKTGGQIHEAAKLLNISRTTLWEKMRRLYISGYTD